MAGQEGQGAVALPRVNPEWRHKPSGEDLAEAYPPRAWREDVEGRATIACKTTIDGSLEACSIVSEAPAGYGFGKAALSMTPQFEMEPAIEDGVRQAASVRIPIVFKLPKPEAEPRFNLSPADAVGVGVLGSGLVLVVALLALNDWLQARTGAPVVRIGRGIIFALKFIVRAWKAVPGPLAVCVAIAAAEFAMTIAWPESPLVGLLFGLPLLVAEVFAYAACHRLALAQCGPPGRMALGRFGFQARKLEGDVAVSWLISGVIFAAALLAIVIVAGILGVTIGLMVDETTRAAVVGLIVAVALGGVLYVAGRLYILPAAFAVGGVDTLGQAWRLARGAVFAALVAMAVGPLLLFVVVAAVLAPAYFLVPDFDVPFTGGSLAQVLSTMLLLPFSAGLISYFYLETGGAGRAAA